MRKLSLYIFLLLPAAVAAADFTGHYETNWGVVELRQQGKKVTGTYTSPAAGEIEGTLDGDVLIYKWWQVNGVWGKGRFRLSDRGHKLSGTWGHGISDDSGGIWEGTRKH